MPMIADKVPEGLRPYQFHGVNIDYGGSGDSVYGDCPFCGAEGKFNIVVKTGVFRCNRCNKGEDKGRAMCGGNANVFLKYLWEMSEKATTVKNYEELAEQRGLIYPETLISWGICKSVLTRDWLVPGYGPEGQLRQLYRYIGLKDRMALLLTPTLGHQLYGVNLYTKKKEIVYLCEAWGDATALWEMLGLIKETDGRVFALTANKSGSLLANTNVLAIPTATIFNEAWLPLFAGKDVRLMSQSDHPKRICSDCKKTYSIIESQCCPNRLCNGNKEGQELEPVGYRAMVNIAHSLASFKSPPKSISILQWGEVGYDPKLPSGYDLRDHLNLAKTVLASRLTRFEEVVRRLVPFSLEGLGSSLNGDSKTKEGGNRVGAMQPEFCNKYSELLLSWRKAMRWRQEMDDVLSIMLAVALSTEQIGDQLFLMLIGDAGSGKTRFCDAMLVSQGCYALEHLTGFHSGWKDNEGNDYSLLSRINRKTLITPEGDVLMSSPSFASIMSQQRRIFDGSSGASFKNMKVDQSYTGLRTPWIIAGTPALMDTDQSRLGDRFLKVILNPPDDDERTEILRRVAHTALRSVQQKSDGTPESQIDARMGEAYRKTGGYVDWLRSNTDLLSTIEVSDEALLLCSAYGEFTAYIRARPGSRLKAEQHDTKEMPTRLTSQYVRAAVCMAVVLNRDSVDSEVMRRVKKLALDTAKGQVLEIVRKLFEEGETGLEVASLAMFTHHTEDKTRNMLRFLRQIGVVDTFKVQLTEKTFSRPKWRLTEKLTNLWEEVHR